MIKQTTIGIFKLLFFFNLSNFSNFSKNGVLFWFWAIFDLKFGLLAENDVECSAPDLKGRLGVDFLVGTFFSQTPVFRVEKLEN